MLTGFEGVMSTDNSSIVLEAHGIRKAYDGILAVKDVSLSVRRGEIVGLVGPNGSGKTTLADCVCGAQSADAGSVWLSGHDISSLPAHKRAHLGLARTFQTARTFPPMRLLDHFLLASQEFDGIGWWRAFLDKKEVKDSDASASVRARELLDLVDLREYELAPAKILSYGQMKLFALALALANSPVVVFLDEPLSGVHPRMVERIERVLLRLGEIGQTLVVIEHNLEFVSRVCDRVLVLSAGELMVEGPPQLLWTDKRVFHAFIGGEG